MFGIELFGFSEELKKDREKRKNGGGRDLSPHMLSAYANETTAIDRRPRELLAEEARIFKMYQVYCSGGFC